VTHVSPTGPLLRLGVFPIALPSNINSTICSERKLSIRHIQSTSMCLTCIMLTSLRFGTLGKAALMSMRSMPVMWPFVQAA